MRVVSRAEVEDSTTTMQWTRRAEDVKREETLLGRWNLAGAVAVLCDGGDPSLLLQVLSAMMVERPLIVHGTSLDVVSGVTLALHEMIKPFVYQAVSLPVLPPSLLEILEAPVPFIAGLHSSCVPASLSNTDAVVVNLDARRLTTAGARLEKLPGEADLKRYVVVFFSSFGSHLAAEIWSRCSRQGRQRPQRNGLPIEWGCFGMRRLAIFAGTVCGICRIPTNR